MNKHAYLIIAHNNVEQLKILLKLLDYKYNDIYVHIDLKYKYNDFNVLYKFVKYSKLKIYQKIDVKWGGYSQIEVELFLLKKAITKNYKYYHLISGADLPLKSQKYIHEFFEKNSDIEFIDIDNSDKSDETEIVRRIKYYYIFTDYSRTKNKFISLLKRYITTSVVVLQKIFNINRCNKNFLYKKGSQWFSITHNCALYIINNEPKIKKMCNYGKCVDEIFLQTLVYNSDFYKNIYSSKEKYNLAMRFIDWKHGNPYVFKKDDFDRLIKSDALFARKFDINIDADIIHLISNYIIRS